MKTQPFEKHVWAEIDLDALRHNFRAVKARAGDLPLCAVVKADSYGHGAVQCARVFAQEGAAWLAVSCLTEAVQLRQDGQTLPILILGHVQPEYAQTLIHEDITVACYSTEQAQNLSAAAVKAGGRVKIHLKADTGMGRIGFALRTDFDAAIREMLAVCALPGLEMTGLFQHFSVADDTAEENVAYTAEQHALFVRAFHALKAAGREPQTVHCDNSAGVMLHPDWPEGLARERCMARPGIILYGYDPSDEVRFGQFRPVMTLKTVVSMVKEMQPGQSASYGRRFTADKPTLVATLCTGYADGYPRQLSCGKGIVEIHGKACPVLGRVCMDQMMVDVTGIPDIHEATKPSCGAAASVILPRPSPARPTPFPTRCCAACPAACPASTSSTERSWMSRIGYWKLKFLPEELHGKRQYPQFLYHCTHRPRQIHPVGPYSGADQECGRAHHGRPDFGQHGH